KRPEGERHQRRPARRRLPRHPGAGASRRHHLLRQLRLTLPHRRRRGRRPRHRPIAWSRSMSATPDADALDAPLLPPPRRASGSLSRKALLGQTVTGREVPFRDGELIVSCTDLRGIVTYVNEYFCEISGYGEAELIGRQHNLIRHP